MGDQEMKARDVMTSAVTSVGPDTPIREVAKILRNNGISAVPVVGEAGAPIGMISEGDLIGRDEADREARRDWWLNLIAEGEMLNADFLASLRPLERRARDLMTAPVVTVSEETEVSEIARMLTSYRIKRVPVLRDGRIVGIVSRADLVRALATEETGPAHTSRGGGLLADAVTGIERRFLHRRQTTEQAPPTEARSAPDETRLIASNFRRLMADHEQQEVQHRQEHRRAEAARRRRRVAEMIDEHISDESWRVLVHEARRAAERGEKEFMILRFPCQLCGDGGRAVNAAESDWPTSLRGEAAEIYLRWERDLKPNGFGLAGRILDFPGGMPGDVGLFLTWEQ
jgi:CBS domain-containing protein